MVSWPLRDANVALFNLWHHSQPASQAVAEAIRDDTMMASGEDTCAADGASGGITIEAKATSHQKGGQILYMVVQSGLCVCPKDKSMALKAAKRKEEKRQANRPPKAPPISTPQNGLRVAR